MISGYGGGHTFVEGVCSCGRKLVDLQNLTLEDVGKPGIAHSGLSNEAEIISLNALVKKMHDHFDIVFGWQKREPVKE
jgi:hypothetical protein